MLQPARPCRHTLGHVRGRRLAVFEALCEASVQEVLLFNLHNVTDRLWATTETAIERLAVFMSLREATVQEVLDFNALSFAGRLWAMTETGIEKLAVFEALCEASAKEVLRFNPHNVFDTLCGP